MVQKFKIPDPFDRIFTVTVNVTQAGNFTCVLPAAIASLFAEHDIALNVNTRGSKGFFSSDTLQGLRASVETAIDLLCSEKIIEETEVIRYAISTACSYAFDRNGELVPHPVLQNYRQSDPGEATDWRNGTEDRNATTSGPYGVQFYAHPFKKTTYQYAANGKTRVKYTTLREHSFAELGPDDNVQWLARLTGLASDTSHFVADSRQLQEVPCTPKTAKFFVNLFKSVFMLNERIKPYLHPEGVMEMANAMSLSGKSMALLGAGGET